MSRTTVQRPKRTPINTRNRLTVHNKEAGYEYRIVNDIDDRIDIFKANGWELVPQKDIKVGDKRVEAPSSEGSSAYISVGGGQKAAVMRIPSDWYAEDQAAKQAEITRLEQTMTQEALNGNYGKIEITRG